LYYRSHSFNWACFFLLSESGIDNPDFHDDESTVNDDDITVSDISTLGATGVDHSTLVREVETCE